ncbi:MAG: hypothetical protein FWH11_07680 [Micrococcales bacterium]|nr:hypothetical protein [Micrococcales bacterium]
MTRPNRTRTAAEPPPPPAPAAPSGDPASGGPVRRRPPGRRVLGRWGLFLAAVSVSCLALAVWSFGRATERVDTRLPLPEVVDGTVPVVWQGTPQNFTVRGKVAGQDQEYLVGDPTPGDGSLRIEIALDHTVNSWGGWMFTRGYYAGPGARGQLDWGKHPRCGYDLSGATALTVVSRGGQGGERVEVFTLGQGYDPESGLTTADWPDSANKVRQTVTLTDQFETYTIDLRGIDLHYVGNGFGLTATAADNADAQSVVVELADVRFELPDAAQTIADRADAADRARRTDLGIGWATLLAAVVGAVGVVVKTWIGTRRETP